MHRTGILFGLLPVLVAVALVGTISPGALHPARAAEASLVFAALQLLKDKHVSKPEPVKLLAAGAGGMRQALADAGVAGFQGEVSAATEDAAKVQFQARFDQAAVLAQGKVSERQLQYAAVKAMTRSLDDSHTWFMTAEELAQAQLAGIGVRFVSREDKVYVIEVFPNSPAARAGVRVFDRVVTVDGRPAEGTPLQELVNQVRGRSESAISIVVRRPGQSEPITFSINRAPIAPPIVDRRTLEGSVGYIRLARFVRGATTGPFKQAVEDLQRQGMRGFIVDLRWNPGGSNSDGTEVLGLLFPSGTVISSRDDRITGRSTYATSGTPVVASTVGLVLIINGDTGSMAELFAATIREYNRGKLVGTRSAGALMWNERFPLPGGGELSISTGLQRTAKGTLLEKNGLSPDYEVDLTADALEQGVDSQLQRALEVLK